MENKQKNVKANTNNGKKTNQSQQKDKMKKKEEWRETAEFFTQVVDYIIGVLIDGM